MSQNFVKKCKSRNRKNEILQKKQMANKQILKKTDENNIYANRTSYIHEENMMEIFNLVY